MKRSLIIIVLMILGLGTAFAVPAKRGIKKTLTLKDGKHVEATLMGDEYVHYYQTQDERVLQYIDGNYQYVNRDSLLSRHEQLLNEHNRMRKQRRAAVPRKNIYKGQRRGLVIMVEFADVKFTYGRDDFNDYFNKSGYNFDGMAGSVHDYFLEQSYGQFDLEFDVVGPVTLTNKAEYYGYDFETTASQNQRVAQMVNTICRQLDSQIDYSQYDWDGDGVVDQVYVIYAGYGAAQGADHTIWPHEWTVRGGTSNPYKTAEGVTIDTYGISCELRGDGSRNTGHIDGIGTSCHEFSHCLGLPDFYDTKNQKNFGMSDWDLMDSGCYNGSTNGSSPSGYTAYERWFAGWLEPIELSSSRQVVDMPAIQEEPVAYILYNDANRNEYYLLENYQQIGFDQAGGGHGLLFLHVDYDQGVWNSNAINQEASHQRMTIIAADNNYSAKSLAGDPFPGKNMKTELTNTSSPRSSLYNANADGSKLMGKPITDISEVNGLITFNCMGGIEVTPPVADAASDVSETGFVANWQPVDNVVDYTVCLTQTLSPDAVGTFAIFEDEFETFRADAISSDLSKSLDKYTTVPGWSGKNLYASPDKLLVGQKNAAGELLTPWFEQPIHDTLSIVIAPISASRLTTTSLQFRIYTSSGGYMYADIDDLPLLGSPEAGTGWVLSAEWTYGKFQIGVYPKESGSGVNMDYLGAFDGTVDVDEEEEAPAMLPRRMPNLATLNHHNLQWESVGLSTLPSPRLAPRVIDTFYTTKETHYTFTDLEPASYSYKVRANTEYGVSPWSDEIFVDLSNAIESVKTDTPQPSAGKVYLLDGRQVTGSSLRPGIYIRDGKKFLVR